MSDNTFIISLLIVWTASVAMSLALLQPGVIVGTVFTTFMLTALKGFSS